jgi:hypothetical protein
MADDYVELFLKWSPNANTKFVSEWLEHHGFSVMNMKSGLLVSGTRVQIETAFSVDLENVRLPFELTVPAELSGHVASISIPKPRSYHH